MNTSVRTLIRRLVPMTLFVCLALTGIPWLGCLGLILLVLPSLFDSQNRFHKEKFRNLTLACLLLLFVSLIMQIFQDWPDGYAFTKKPPQRWYEIVLLVAWFGFGVTECVRWRKSRNQPAQQVTA